MDAQIVLYSTALFQKGVKSNRAVNQTRVYAISFQGYSPRRGCMELFGGTSSQVAETQVSEKSLAMIGNAPGQDAATSFAQQPVSNPAVAFETAAIHPTKLTNGCFSKLRPGGTQAFGVG